MKTNKKIILLIDNAGDFISLFKRVMEREKLDQDFKCEEVIPSSAHLLDDCLIEVSNILSRSEEIAVVLVDIVLDESIKPSDKQIKAIDRSGFKVAAEIRRRLPNTPILGITQWSKVQGLLTDITLDGNFDGLLLKGILTSEGFSKNKFYEYLEKAQQKHSLKFQERGIEGEHLTKSNYPQETAGVASPNILSALNISIDPITQVQIEEMGVYVLDRILHKAFGHAEGTVRYFIPGFSGAIIFEVSGRINQEAKSQASVTSWILKVSKNKHKLQLELDKHKILRNKGVEKNFYPNLLTEELITEGAWSAIITQKEPDACPLRLYIQGNPDITTLTELFNTGIKQFVSQLYGQPYKETHFVWQKYYTMKGKEVAAILAVLDERRSTFLKQAGGITESIIKRIEQFVTSNGKSERKLHDYQQDVDTRFIHGDFHARNVLVTPIRNKITTIDFPNINQDHAVKDFAKLESDLIFSVIDSLDGEDTNWASLARWDPLLETLEWKTDFFDNPRIRAGGYSEEHQLINAVRDCSLKVLPTITKEEYLISLLSYTLKTLPYPDISLPKKAFALKYANKVLEQMSY